MSKVFLVGAGPGDPELLTLKAHRLLRQADVVLHDDLVSHAILELARTDAVIINVGKRCGSKHVTQGQIHVLMISFASCGQTVVRLKGGDPLLFGRAAEEMEALAAAHVEYEIVPGITTALAAAAAARIALTDRRTSSTVIFTTAHHGTGKEAPDWSDVARPDATLAIYMPGSDYGRLMRELIAAGLASETPCMVMSRVASRDQRVYRSTLSQLAELPPLPAPSIFLVGKSVASEKLIASVSVAASRRRDKPQTAARPSAVVTGEIKGHLTSAPTG
jgi:uroporphyrin-III C-methyltransferase